MRSAWTACLVITAALAFLLSSYIVLREFHPAEHTIQIDHDLLDREETHCLLLRTLPVPEHALLRPRSDRPDAARQSELRLFEDGLELGPPHSAHAVIRNEGGGTYSHWADTLRFSSSDNSDPAENGRSYIVLIPLQPPERLWIAGVALSAVSAGCLIIWTARFLGVNRRHIAATAVCVLIVASGTITATALVSRANLIRGEIPITEFVPLGNHAYQVWQTARPLWAPVLRENDGTVHVFIRRNGAPLRIEPSTRQVVRASNGAGHFAVEDLYFYFAPPQPSTAGEIADTPGGLDAYTVDCVFRAPWSVVLVLTILFGATVVTAAPLYRLLSEHRPWYRRLTHASIACGIPGLFLLGLNVVGLILPLRSPQIYTEDEGYDTVLLTYEEAIQQLTRDEGESDRAYAFRVYEIVRDSMLHYWHTRNAAAYRMRIPAWENFILYLRAQIASERNDVLYPFADPYRTVERGIGLCGHKSHALAHLLRERGIAAEVVELKHHTVATAEVEPGVWYIFDADLHTVVPHSLNSIEANPDLLLPFYRTALQQLNFQSEAERRSWVQRVHGWYASAEDNAIGYDQASRIERERLMYQLKWAIPGVLIIPLVIVVAVSRLCGPRG